MKTRRVEGVTAGWQRVLIAGLWWLMMFGGTASLFSAVPTIGAAPAIPQGVSVLPYDVLRTFSLAGEESDQAEVAILEANQDSFTQVARVKTKSNLRAEWNAQLVTKTTGPIRTGDVVLARFWLRNAGPAHEPAAVGFVFEWAEPAFDKAADQRVDADTNWQEVFIPFVSHRDFPPGMGQLVFRLGTGPQTIELGGIELRNLGQGVNVDSLPQTRISYEGREDNAPWRKAAIERIDAIRKGNLTISVVDAAGNPVAGAKVRVKMRRHAFGFGSAVTATLLTEDSDDARRYRDFVEKNFNRAVFENDMKWPAVYDGIPPRLDQALNWLRERKIAVRGHCLIWPKWETLPRELASIKEHRDKLRRKCETHIAEEVTHFRGKLYAWDVINEPYSHRDLMDLLGREVMIDWFRTAHQADPDCVLFLNDYGILEGGGKSDHRQSTFETIRWLKQSGAPIGGIGIQSHFGGHLVPPVELLRVLDQFAELQLPIESTEVSFTIRDRQLQADYMRDYMTVMFSHPAVQSVMLWGFWEGRHWRPQAALFDKDWTARPQAKVWLDLVQRQWKTDVTCITDSAGLATVRGFCGEYEVTAPAGHNSPAESVQLARDGASLRLVLR